MTNWQLALKSFFHYLRSNLTVALGVAAATAVLTGALIVGESMRGSLRELTLDRLGEIDEVIVSDGFFRAQLAEELLADNDEYAAAVPVILFPNGTVELDTPDGKQRANNVNVFGVPKEFWSLGDGIGNPELTGREIAVNQELADQFQSADDLVLTLRIPKPTQLPSESALGKTRDLVESLTRLKVKKTFPNKSVARFSLQPNQAEPLNIFLPIELLQDSLLQTALKFKSDPNQVNAIFLAGKGSSPPSEATTDKLVGSMRPTFDDLGYTLKRVTQEFEGQKVFDYWAVSSDRLLIGNEAAKSIRAAFPDAKEVFTYLANDIRKSGEEAGVPYSMVTAIDFGGEFQPEFNVEQAGKLAENEIVLNDWAAKNLGVNVGDTIDVAFFEPETTHGVQIENKAKFTLVNVVDVTKPASPFLIRRRGPIRPAIFDQLPTLVNDPDLTPTVPGVTDAESIESWDLPFETKNRLRPEDDEYWENYRTTPKAFISLKAGQGLWRSRFGQTTSFRIPIEGQGSGEEALPGAELRPSQREGGGAGESIAEKIIQQLNDDEVELGFHLIPIKRQGLLASAGSTPFDVLFLSLSMFVIGAALILVSLLFQLALSQRLDQVGVMTASGFTQKRITRIWLCEAILISLVGAIAGVAIGIAYAWLMIWGLKTWWVGAISRPFLNMHVGWISLVGGLLSGLVVSVFTIVRAVRKTKKQTVRQLLSGNVESHSQHKKPRRGLLLLAVVMIVMAIGLAVVATQLGGEAQAGSFVGAGFLVMSALLIFVWHWLKRPVVSDPLQLGLGRMAISNAKRNPLRSTLTIGLVAVAAFLIASISSFHLSPVEEGTAGFDFVAESSQPVFADLSTRAGQVSLLGEENLLPPETGVFPFRLKPGQDASCNNLYQSTQPRLLGVTPDFVQRFDDAEITSFAFAGSSADSETEKSNPWNVLAQPVTESGAIPVLIDKNTAWYSLKVFLIGQEFTVDYDSGETVRFQVAGFLSNSILQGSLLCSEENFKNTFPSIGGYRYFLLDTSESTKPDEASTGAVNTLEDRLGDLGFDARDSRKMLANFLAVQNTYLSTFQTLGALGLLLGTFGLGAVSLRNVIERQREFGLMRAVGWGLGRISNVVRLETVFLLLAGLAIGVVSALLATLPHYFIGAASIPFLQLFLMFGFILLVGLVTAAVAARLIFRLPLLGSLR